ncbi:Apolipoprotein L3 [Collichthys lucidus]|uniref:Apolipoprotein L3 n=1 Tax=Collichthys lucidus TaxID=240159 RepID=A0A4U5VX21_COLLU|nr:Apolipoprotein L3 [Collichthys lucidus]
MNMFRRDLGSTAPTPAVPPRPSEEDLDNPITHSLSGQDVGTTAATWENSSEVNPKPKRAGVMGVMQKVNPFKSTSQASSSSSSVSKAPSSETLEQETDLTRNPGVLKGVMQKVNPFKSTSQVTKAPSSESLEQGRVPDSGQSPGMLRGVMQKVNPFKPSTQAPKGDPPNDAGDPAETEKEVQGKQNPGKIAGMMQKVNPFKSSQPKDTQSLHSDLSSSSGSLTDNNNFPEKQNPGKIAGMMQKVNPFKSSRPKDTQSLHSDLSSSSGSLTDNNNLPEKQNPGVFKGMMQKVNPFRSYTQDKKAIDRENSSSSESLDDSTTERHTIWYADADPGCEVQNQPTAAPKRRTLTFRIKRILPTALFGSGTKDSATASSDTPQETVEVQTLELAEVPVPSEGTVLDPLDDEDGLLAWWGTVEGWDEWNDGNQDEEAEDAVEEAADRVFMAARLFVRFFNQRGASLQKRILELLSLADAADTFHKKTVTASVGGGVASVAGSITTITGLILAPFTAGTSLIVTAVGIGVATAGGVASASANITDTVHSKTDRKKVEKMIQDYEEEIKDIKECLEFLQEGMETLEEWNFEKYAEAISKKHLNQNIKHVMKEGGRAGKALMINTESLISTVQVLSVAGGAAKAAQVMSVTTGVMSGLFLALDVFFLAKDSVELRKGAKTEFATKIREVCKDLQEGLLELNRIKEQLQFTMDGIEVEVEEEEVDENLLKSELKKLVELEE